MASCLFLDASVTGTAILLSTYNSWDCLTPEPGHKQQASLLGQMEIQKPSDSGGITHTGRDGLQVATLSWGKHPPVHQPPALLLACVLGLLESVAVLGPLVAEVSPGALSLVAWVGALACWVLEAQASGGHDVGTWLPYPPQQTGLSQWSRCQRTDPTPALRLTPGSRSWGLATWAAGTHLRL